jgi:hypothetical protein
LVVSSQGDSLLQVYSRTAETNDTALRTIAGASTGLSGPTRIDVVPIVLFVDGFEEGFTTYWSSTVDGSV